VTATTDVAHAIPSVLVNRIIEKLETIGMILPLVTKTSFPAGMAIPISNVKPVATWVNEGASSLKQKKSTAGTIAFTHFKLRCEIAMTMETSVMAISAFEAAFVRQVSEAMIKAIEAAILGGNGVTQPKGILLETPASGQTLTAKALDYKLLVDAEAALPQAYEAGAKWCMTKKTFMAFVGMTDAEGQPIARVNYGIGGKPERTLLGREVVLCGDYMDSFSSTLEDDKIFAFLFNFSDYTLNTNYNMGIQRKQDWDTEDLLTKAVMAVDGKVVDKNSLVTIKKVS
jgi:HK97 family phage major capsid protein